MYDHVEWDTRKSVEHSEAESFSNPRSFSSHISNKWCGCILWSHKSRWITSPWERVSPKSERPKSFIGFTGKLKRNHGVFPGQRGFLYVPLIQGIRLAGVPRHPSDPGHPRFWKIDLLLVDLGVTQNKDTNGPTKNCQLLGKDTPNFCSVNRFGPRPCNHSKLRDATKRGKTSLKFSNKWVPTHRVGMWQKKGRHHPEMEIAPMETKL